MKPLLARAETVRAATKFHHGVFKRYGGPRKVCFLCFKPGASDAAHVVPRSKLGPLRYADVRLGRPAHRVCHERQERGLIDFMFEIRLDAIRCHNEIAKIKLVEPTE